MTKYTAKNARNIGNTLDTEPHTGMVFEAEDISDGYHTFNELYDHRLALTVALFKVLDNYITPLVRTSIKCWKSKLHFDGTMFDRYFIVGMTINTFNGIQFISYHYELEHWNKFNVMELDKAPEYDGYTSQDVIERLMKL